MQRSDLEKLIKEELIELILTMHNNFQAKIAELEARLNLNNKNSSKPPSTDTWKNPNIHAKKQTKNQAHKKDTKTTD
jgi:hypothetical protein